MAKIRDLFEEPAESSAPAESPAPPGRGATGKSYTAKDIEVLEGLEPVRRRPGMYIGGTDGHAMHHLAAEIMDNAMDEAVAGHANRIEIELKPDDILIVRDNGRGIPIDPHPKFKNKSALEVIMTTLHAGGKFGGKVYDTSGGLHGVGASVVNALSEWMEVEVARDRRAYLQRFERGVPASKLKDLGPAPNRRGTIVSFKPDTKIFGDAQFLAAHALPHGAFQGLSLPRRRNPLEMRCLAAQAGMGDSGRGCAEISRRPARFPEKRTLRGQDRHAPLLRPDPEPRRQGRRGMGHRLVAANRSFRPFLLQHHPHAAGRHA